MKFCINIISAVMAILLVLTGIAHASLLVTDGAEPVAAKHVEVELNGSYLNDRSDNGGVMTKTNSTGGDLTITAGITKSLDGTVVVPYTFSGRDTVDTVDTVRTEGFNDITITCKYKFFEADGVKLAIKPGLILPTGKSSAGLSDGKFGYTAALLATREFNKGTVLLHANAGYQRHNYKDDAVMVATRQDLFTFSIACEAEIAAGMKLAADTGLATNSDRAGTTPPAYALIGVKYELTRMLEGYAGVKFGLTGPEADVTALFGAVLKF